MWADQSQQTGSQAGGLKETGACKPILVVTQNKIMNLELSITCPNDMKSDLYAHWIEHPRVNGAFFFFSFFFLNLTTNRCLFVYSNICQEECQSWIINLNADFIEQQLRQKSFHSSPKYNSICFYRTMKAACHGMWYSLDSSSLKIQSNIPLTERHHHFAITSHKRKLLSP